MTIRSLFHIAASGWIDKLAANCIRVITVYLQHFSINLQPFLYYLGTVFLFSSSSAEVILYRQICSNL